MSDYFRFAAFISYSSKDKVFAKKLMKSLEGYTIPRRLGEFDLTGAGKKNRVYPVFKDREELSAGGLDEQLKAALRASANLIVISSENAKQSEWVDLEIEYFASLGKQDKIFTIISPDSGDDKDANTELFPNSLIELFGVPLAADARPTGDGFHNALLKVIAGAVSINAGKLKDRDRSRRRNRLIAGASALVGLFAIAATSIWAFALPSYTYSKNYVRVFGKLTPVDIISADQAAQRQLTYRFKKFGHLGSVDSMELINSAGQCSDVNKKILSLTGDAFEFECNVSRACAIKQLYENGQVAGEEIRDQVGNVLERVSYLPGSSQAIREEAVIGCSRLDNGIKFIEIERSEHIDTLGFDRKISFFAARDMPRANSEFSYGYLIERDKDGRLIRKTTTDKDGAPALNKNGYSINVKTYNSEGDNVESTYLDQFGQLTDTAKVAARYTFEYDSAGNDVLEYKFTSNGSANTDLGYHARRFTYDAKGNLSSLEYLNPSMTLTPTKNGVARAGYQRNQDGYVIERTYWAQNEDAPISTCAHEKFELNEYGTRTRGSCFTLERDATIYDDGYHSWNAVRDASLNLIESEFYSIDGTPALTKGGYSRREFTWNELGQKVATAHFGLEGEPAINNQGIHKWTDEYDANGYRVRSYTYDADGNPVYDNNSIYLYEMRRDNYGRLIQSIPHDIKGNVIDNPAYHYKAEYDEFDNVTAYIHLNKDGDVAKQANGFAIQRRRHDAQGRLSEVRFFDVDNNPVQGWYGAFIVRYAHNSLGKRIEYEFLNEDEAPMLGNRGAAYERYKYDAMGHTIERSFFGLDGQPVDSTFGAHRIVWDQDVFDQTLSGRYFDKDGNPAISPQGGYHGWSNVWDTRGNMIEQSTHDVEWEISPQTDDRKYATLKSKFDNYNRLIERTYFDEAGSPVQNQLGVYGFAYEYDNHNRVVKETYLGPDGQPKSAPESQTAFETNKYNSRGRVVEIAYYQEDGTPITDYAAIQKITLNRFGNWLLSEGFSSDGVRQPLQTTGQAIAEYSYDQFGNLLTEHSFDTSNQPMNRLDKKWFRKIADRSASGALLSEACFTTEDVEVPCNP